MIAHLIEAAICLAPFVGIPILCHFDPAGHYAAEVARRQSS
jgi:hypothetical protein